MNRHSGKATDLMLLEARSGYDKRFRMDEKFIDASLSGVTFSFRFAFAHCWYISSSVYTSVSRTATRRIQKPHLLYICEK